MTTTDTGPTTDATTMSSALTAPLEAADLLRILPHRWPFLLVDRVTHLEPGKSVMGVKAVGFNEPWFAGHFPGEPVFPGVLLLEAMAQVAGILAHATASAEETPGAPRFLSADRVKFRRAVVPGDLVELRAELLQRRAGVFRVQGQARVGGMVAAEAELLIGSVAR